MSTQASYNMQQEMIVMYTYIYLFSTMKRFLYEILSLGFGFLRGSLFSKRW